MPGTLPGMRKYMFYTFNQNNSGGSFKGPHYIIIEANSAQEANSLAQNHTVYFDGCREGIDCSCCGDRWHKVDGSGNKLPSIYGTEVPETKEQFIKNSFDFIADWWHEVTESGTSTCIYDKLKEMLST